MKEYNEYELRFLQVLVPKEEYFDILVYHHYLYIDHVLWQRDDIRK